MTGWRPSGTVRACTHAVPCTLRGARMVCMNVYNDIWEASVGEELLCQCEDGHAADPYDMLLIGLRIPSVGR